MKKPSPLTNTLIKAGLGLGLAASLLALSACGGGGSSTNPPPPTTQDTFEINNGASTLLQQNGTNLGTTPEPLILSAPYCFGAKSIKIPMGQDQPFTYTDIKNENCTGTIKLGSHNVDIKIQNGKIITLPKLILDKLKGGLGSGYTLSSVTYIDSGKGLTFSYTSPPGTMTIYAQRTSTVTSVSAVASECFASSTIGINRTPLTLKKKGKCRGSFQVGSTSCPITFSSGKPDLDKISSKCGDATLSWENNTLTFDNSGPTPGQLGADFPYGITPKYKIPTTHASTGWATPEGLLGSWAMQKALTSDLENKQLPHFMTDQNTVYAIGTAAVDAPLGLPQNNDPSAPTCSGSYGCDALNGVCFALHLNGNKHQIEYMIFQNVNRGADRGTFDVYTAGGGGGTKEGGRCKPFFGGSVNWESHIGDYRCSQYFSTLPEDGVYNVRYKGTNYNSNKTEKDACKFAEDIGLTQKHTDISAWQPVTCPTSLTQITGIRPASSGQTTIGKTPILKLDTLTETTLNSGTWNDFYNDPSTTQRITTTMQDCNVPSSGQESNMSHALPTESPYTGSIAATAQAPNL